ncbi:hypothetical protein ACFX2J_031457 [Malus domestica]
MRGERRVGSRTISAAPFSPTNRASGSPTLLLQKSQSRVPRRRWGSRRKSQPNPLPRELRFPGRRSRSPSRGLWSRFLLRFDMERMEVLKVFLDKFFDMEYPDCVKAFDAYASEAERMERRGQRVWWVGAEERMEG